MNGLMRFALKGHEGFVRENTRGVERSEEGVLNVSTEYVQLGNVGRWVGACLFYAYVVRVPVSSSSSLLQVSSDQQQQQQQSDKPESPPPSPDDIEQKWKEMLQAQTHEHEKKVAELNTHLQDSTNTIALLQVHIQEVSAPVFCLALFFMCWRWE
jgi:hypothetical protein